MIVPTNGNSAARVAQPTSIGSSIRRRASANVQKTSASHTTIRTRMRTLTAVLSASLSMPKTPKVSMGGGRNRSDGTGWLQEHPAESVPEREEHQNRERHHDGHQGDHPEDAGTLVVHNAEALLAPGSETRSAIT